MESMNQAQNINNNSNFEEEKEQENDISKIFIRPWEEIQLKKNQHGLAYTKENNFHIPY